MSSSLREKYKFDSGYLDERLKSTDHTIGPNWADLTAREGYLRVHGRASLTSSTNQSILGRPIIEPHLTIVTKLDFKPTNLSQSAGLISFFDNGFWQYLSMVGFENEKYLHITTCTNYDIIDHYKQRLDNVAQDLELKMSIENEKVLFYYSEVKHQWQKIGPTLKVDREHINDRSLFGICCLDHFGRMCHADFEYFTYMIHK